MAIGKAERDAMPEEWFAFPRTKQGPMPDANHAQLAWDMIERTKGVSDADRSEARDRVLRRAKDLGVDTSGWNKLKAMHFDAGALSAMAVIMPDVPDHPNKMPFSGVMTKLGQPSDQPVGGSSGLRVIIPHAVAEAAIPSLIGMAVDFMPDLDGHDPQRKIGIFTGATVIGDDLCVEGFLYAADFPEETARIKSLKDVLGFSYETAQNYGSVEGGFLVLAACTFTGAAILRKDKAAYQTTSLAASAAGDIEMTKEELAELMAAAVAPLAAGIAELKTENADLKIKLAASEETRSKVEPHAKALDACADSMEAAAVGAHASSGHVAVLRRMSGAMRAEAAIGKIPHIYRDHDYAGGSMYAGADGGSVLNPPAENAEMKALKDQVASLGTKLADQQAAARDQANQPERKTLSPAIGKLLAKAGIETPEGEAKLTSVQVDTALKGQSISQRMQTKAALAQAGLLDAA